MQAISEIKNELSKALDKNQLQNFLDTYSNDERSGVIKLCESAVKKITAIDLELQRTFAMYEFERENAELGLLCGIDEVGRGPLAGPVYAAAVILPNDCNILYLNDSKKLSEKKREELYDVIMDKAVAVGIGHADCSRIDEINILQATY